MIRHVVTAGVGLNKTSLLIHTYCFPPEKKTEKNQLLQPSFSSAAFSGGALHFTFFAHYVLWFRNLQYVGDVLGGRIYVECIGDALGMHLECIEDVLGTQWGHIEDRLGTHWRHIGDA